MLEKLGYRADVAANGLEAIEALERQPYDLLLSDVQMPEMDGLEATRQILERWPEGERPWIVAMTAEAMSGDRERCLAAGMNDYVAKPIRVEELVAAIKRTPRRDGASASAPADAHDIATRIAQEHGLSADAPKGTREHALQNNVSDATFLRRIAQREGNQLRVEGTKLVVGPPPAMAGSLSAWPRGAGSSRTPPSAAPWTTAGRRRSKR